MQVLTCQAVSTSVRRRFPTLDHIEAVGLFTPEERIAYDQVIGKNLKNLTKNEPSNLKG